MNGYENFRTILGKSCFFRNAANTPEPADFAAHIALVGLGTRARLGNPDRFLTSPSPVLGEFAV